MGITDEKPEKMDEPKKKGNWKGKILGEGILH